VIFHALCFLVFLNDNIRIHEAIPLPSLCPARERAARRACAAPMGSAHPPVSPWMPNCSAASKPGTGSARPIPIPPTPSAGCGCPPATAWAPGISPYNRSSSPSPACPTTPSTPPLSAPPAWARCIISTMDRPHRKALACAKPSCAGPSPAAAGACNSAASPTPAASSTSPRPTARSSTSSSSSASPTA
jgi:hypothetical protein